MQVNEYKPLIVAFCCNWCSYAGADLAGNNRLNYPAEVKIIRVPCSCRVNPSFVLRAFQRGADGVIICGCHPGDCHYSTGNYYAFEEALLDESVSTIIKNEKGRIEAPEGGHDDEMMGLAIAHQIREQVIFDEEPLIPEWYDEFGTDDFYDNDNESENVLVFPGNHDCQTIHGWYKTLSDEDKERLKEFLRRNECYDINVNIGIMQYCMKCKAKIAIITVQDILGLPYGGFLPIYIVFMAIWVCSFYLINDRKTVKSIFKKK